MKRSCGYVWYVFLAFILFHCKEETGGLYLPETLEKNYTLVFNDSITVKTSTVLLDSIPNSNRGILLIGKYDDDKLGIVESRPHFQIIYGNGWILDSEATYDSMVLLMNYSGYYYGDTTKTQTIEVRRVLSDLKTSRISTFWIEMGLYSYLEGNGRTGSIYNESSFTVESSPLGSATYLPRPRKGIDTIRVRLNDALGNEFFQKKLQNSFSMSDPQHFLDTYFKGLAINSLSNSNIIGVDPKNVRVRIYYKEKGSERLVRKHFDFLAVSDNESYPFLLNYNKILTDRSGTSLAALSPQNEIPSTLTDDESYIQSSVGLVTKLTFPGLLNVASTPGFKQLTFARLVLEPVKDTYNSQTYLPNQLVLFRSNRTNIPFAPLTANIDLLESTGIESGATHTYSFIVTQYIQSIISSNTNVKDVVVLLSTPLATNSANPSKYEIANDNRNNIFKTVTRIAIGNGQRAKYRARLEIYYLKENN